jgi:hypothetical protein
VVGWRKSEVDEPDVRVSGSDGDLHLRDESDPDPLIEEMVERLRTGLSSLTAIDEWGRPIAWRNVVRLALGPLSNRLRDTEQALEIAVSMLPPTAEAVEPSPEPVPSVEPDPAPEPEPAPVAEAESLPLHEETVQAQVKTVEVILPAAQSQPERPLEGKQGETTPASIFRRSGDEGAVPMRTLSTRELLSRGGPHDPAAAQYDRFLAGLHGQGQQVRRDQDRRSGGTSLGNHL